MFDTEDQIRELLQECSSQPPGNVDRLRQVEDGIGRARRRRIAAWAGTGTAAAVISAGLVAGLVAPGSLIPDGFSGQEVAAQPPLLPELFIGGDGAIYRNVAKTSLRQTPKLVKQRVEEPGEYRGVKLKIPVRGNPLDVVVRCNTGPKAKDRQGFGPWVEFSVNGEVHNREGENALPCDGKIHAIPLPLPRDTKNEVTLTFGISLVSGDVTADWALGVYEWTASDKSKDLAAAPELPKTGYVPSEAPVAATGRLREYRKAQTLTGTWPRDRTVKFTVPDHGQALGFAIYCRGEAAERVEAGLLVNGQLTLRTPCVPPKYAIKEADLTGLGLPNKYPPSRSDKKDRTVTIELTLLGPNGGRYDAAYQNRPVNWRIGIYQHP